MARTPRFIASGRLIHARPAVVEERTIDVHVKTLRRKLGSADLIETVRCHGYRFREARD